jgi:hypothetical protein
MSGGVTLVNLLISLGLTVEFKKSNLKPSQEMDYLGYHWNTKLMTMEPMERRLIKARHLVKERMK